MKKNELTILGAKNNGEIFSTFEVTDKETGKKLYKAMSTNDKLGDMIGEVIAIKDVITEPVISKDENTGEEKLLTRIIIIDNNDNAISTCSQGIFNSLAKIFKIFGEPREWDEPIEVKISQINVKNNRIYTLEMM